MGIPRSNPSEVPVAISIGNDYASMSHPPAPYGGRESRVHVADNGNKGDDQVERERRREAWHQAHASSQHQQHRSTPLHSTNDSHDREEGEIDPPTPSKAAAHPFRAALVPPEPPKKPLPPLALPSEQQEQEPDPRPFTPSLASATSSDPARVEGELRTPQRDGIRSASETPIKSPLDSLDKLRKFREQVAASRKSAAASELEPARVAAMAEGFLKSQQPQSSNDKDKDTLGSGSGDGNGNGSSNVDQEAQAHGRREMDLKQRLRARQNGWDSGRSPLAGSKRETAPSEYSGRSDQKRPRAEDYNDDDHEASSTRGRGVESRQLQMDRVSNHVAQRNGQERTGVRNNEPQDDWNEAPVQIPEHIALPPKPQTIVPTSAACAQNPWDSTSDTPGKSSGFKVWVKTVFLG